MALNVYPLPNISINNATEPKRGATTRRNGLQLFRVNKRPQSLCIWHSSAALWIFSKLQRNRSTMRFSPIGRTGPAPQSHETSTQMDILDSRGADCRRSHLLLPYHRSQ